MIVVERRSLLEPQIVALAIVAIVLEDGDVLVADALDDAPDDGGLAGSRTAGHADDDKPRTVLFPGGWRGFWRHDSAILTRFFTAFHNLVRTSADVPEHYR